MKQKLLELKGKITAIFLIVAFLLAIVFFFVPLIGNALEGFELAKLNFLALKEKEVEASKKNRIPAREEATRLGSPLTKRQKI